MHAFTPVDPKASGRYLPVMTAPYASNPAESRGRRFPEPESPTRTLFQRDRDRIIHCAAFRRLEYKTQVFVYHEGDYYRTRLTHSLEVAQIARSMCRELGLNEDLAEALALAHDLGHTPFGHAGEEALAQVMEPFGGFDHNAQTLRILTKLERRYAGFDGLNLTWETLEGVVKHNGPLVGPRAATPGTPPLPRAVAEYAAGHDLELDSFPGLEAQIAALSDDIAYNNHDIDDGLRAGLFEVADLSEVPLVGPIFRAVGEIEDDLDPQRLIAEAVRRLIDSMVTDLLVETRRRIEAAGPKTAEEVRRFERPLAAFSEEMRAHDAALKLFLHENMYRHYKVNRMASKARRVVTDLATLFIAEPECLPSEWQRATDGPATERTARVVADYIAGMTDRYALDEHARIFHISFSL
jgi:dGTPase